MAQKSKKKKLDLRKSLKTKEEFMSVLKKVSKKVTPSEPSPSKPRTYLFDCFCGYT